MSVCAPVHECDANSRPDWGQVVSQFPASRYQPPARCILKPLLVCSALLESVGGRTLPEIALRWRAVHPVDIPPRIDGDEHQRIIRGPCLMVHAGGEIVKTTGNTLVMLALVLEDERASNHRVGLVRTVPVHRNVHCL